MSSSPESYFCLTSKTSVSLPRATVLPDGARHSQFLPHIVRYGRCCLCGERSGGVVLKCCVPEIDVVGTFHEYPTLKTIDISGQALRP
jgi:hypothetical protein